LNLEELNRKIVKPPNIRQIAPIDSLKAHSEQKRENEVHSRALLLDANILLFTAFKQFQAEKNPGSKFYVW
jgi:hypothetical protein